MTVAVYAGSFDPPTLGHLDIVLRARKMFPKVEVLVARNVRKSGHFPPDERVDLFRRSLALAGGGDVEVYAWEGLTVDFCRQRGATVLLRGLRQGGDFESEFGISLMNRRLAPEIETVYLPTREECMGITSTLVREIARMGGDVSSFVPAPVAEALALHFPGV